MMGFREERTVYRLVFTEPGYEALEVSAYELTTGELWKFMDTEKTSQTRGAEAEKARLQIMQMLADALVSWNVEDRDGNPVPMTLEGLLARGHRFNARLMDAWTDALVGISGPLPQTSSDGLSSVEASIPMETSLESLAS